MNLSVLHDRKNLVEVIFSKTLRSENFQATIASSNSRRIEGTHQKNDEKNNWNLMKNQKPLPNLG